MSCFEKLNPFENSGNSHSFSSNLFNDSVGSFDHLSQQLPGHSALPNDFNGCKIEIILSPQTLSQDGFRQITQFLNELEQGLGMGQNPLQPLDNIGQSGGAGGGFGLPNPMQALDGITGGAGGGGFGLPNPMQFLDGGILGGAQGGIGIGIPNPMQALEGGLQTGMNATNDVMTGGQDLIKDALSGNPMQLVQDQMKDAGKLLNDLNPMNLLKSIF